MKKFVCRNILVFLIKIIENKKIMGSSLKCQNVENGEEIIHKILSTMNIKEIHCSRAYLEFNKCIDVTNKGGDLQINKSLYTNYINALIGHNSYRDLQFKFFDSLQIKDRKIIGVIVVLLSEGSKNEKSKLLTEIYNKYYDNLKSMINTIIDVFSRYCVTLFRETLGKDSIKMLEEVYCEDRIQKLGEKIVGNFNGVQKKYFSKSVGSDNGFSKINELNELMNNEFFELSLDQLNGEYMRNWLYEEYLRDNQNKNKDFCLY